MSRTFLVSGVISRYLASRYANLSVYSISASSASSCRVIFFTGEFEMKDPFFDDNRNDDENSRCVWKPSDNKLLLYGF